jgi:hypothetical protein
LLPLVEDDAWFFDTELLVWAERRGYPILDWPVRRVEDANGQQIGWRRPSAIPASPPGFKRLSLGPRLW